MGSSQQLSSGRHLSALTFSLLGPGNIPRLGPHNTEEYFIGACSMGGFVSRWCPSSLHQQ